MSVLRFSDLFFFVCRCFPVWSVSYLYRNDETDDSSSFITCANLIVELRM